MLAEDLYLDCSVIGSSGNTGLSWANAWTNCASISWGAGVGSVGAGDTLYVSGGSDTNIYPDALGVGASGSAGSWITIKNGQAEGYNGVAVFPFIMISNRTFVTLDGSKSGSFVSPTSVTNIADIKSNIGIRVLNETNTGNAHGIFVYGTSGSNTAIRWVEVGPIGTTDDIGTCHGVYLFKLDVATNLTVEYSYIHNIQNDGINHESTVTDPEWFDAVAIRWCLIDNTGDDSIQISGNGFTVSHCMLLDHWFPLYNGHPDHIQFAGTSRRYFKLVNNVVRNKANSLVIGEFYVDEDGVLGPMLIAGNIFYNTRDWYYTTNEQGQAYGITFNAWRPNSTTNVGGLITNAENCMWTNVYLLHNTLYYQRATPLLIGRANPNTGEPDPITYSRTRSVTNLYIGASAARNNLLLDCKIDSAAYGTLQLLGSGDPGPVNGVFYTTNDFPMTHNIVAGNNPSAFYHGTTNGDISDFGMSNTNSRPSIETNAYQFVLSSDDAAARNNGFVLSSLTNTYPELMIDLNGIRRFADGSVDIGALEFSGEITNGLVLWFKFEDDLEDGVATDSSTNLAHGYHYGYVDNQTSNRFPDSIMWTNPATALTNVAALFVRTNDGWGIYGYSGDYMVVTQLAIIRQMEQASVMCWNRYLPGVEFPADNWSSTNYLVEHNRRMIGAGYAYSGAWTLGLPSGPTTALRLYTNDGASYDQYFYFPDRIKTSGTGQGDSTNMNHYAFTWSNGLCTLYYNGSPVSTNQTPITTLTVRGPAGSLESGFLEIGGDTHNGNPNLTPEDDVGDQYPNHGYHRGVMDDVRIYNRALSAAEILAVYSGTGAGEEEESVPALSISPTTLTIETLSNAVDLVTNYLVWNSGDTSELLYTNTEAAAWMVLDPLTESSTGEQDEITMTLDREVVGTNQVNVTVSWSNASPQTLSVTLRVTNGVPAGGGTNLQKVTLRGGVTTRGKVTFR